MSVKRYRFESYLWKVFEKEDPNGEFVHYLDYSRVLETLKDLLKGGEHDGPCDNEFQEDEGPCYKHVGTSRARENYAKLVLKGLGEL